MEVSLIPALIEEASFNAENLRGDQQRTFERLAGCGADRLSVSPGMVGSPQDGAPGSLQ